MTELVSGISLSSQFALDVQGTSRLEAAAAGGKGEALKEAAGQFEAIFLHKMLSAMREAVPESGLLQSEQTDFYESLLDQQLAQHLSGKGLGLAEQLVSQLAPAETTKQSIQQDFALQEYRNSMIDR